MLMLGGIFGLALQNIVPDAPVSGVAYADPYPFSAPHDPPLQPPLGLTGFGPK